MIITKREEKINWMNFRWNFNLKVQGKTLKFYECFKYFSKYLTRRLDDRKGFFNETCIFYKNNRCKFYLKIIVIFICRFNLQL